MTLGFFLQNFSQHCADSIVAKKRYFVVCGSALVALGFCLIMEQPTVGQATTGVPPFSTVHDALFDDVKINDGAVLSNLAVRSKSGLIPVTYSITFNNGILGANSLNQPQLGSWMPQTTVGLSRGLQWSASSRTLSCGPKGNTIQLFNFQITDGYGTVHPVIGVQYDTLQCQPTVLTGGTSDGSGLTLALNDPFTTGGGTIYDRAGNSFSGSTAAPYVLQDANGNQLSYAIGGGGCQSVYTYTDTTGSNPITETLTYGSGSPCSGQIISDEHAWTDPSGQTQSVTLNYSPYTWTTEFGCAIPGDVTGIPQNFPSSITTPEGNYLITYESHATGTITGRISKIVLPSGAMIQYQYSGPNKGLGCIVTNGGTVAYAPMVPVLTRTLTDVNGNARTWKYDTTQAVNATLVTDPALNDTVYLFGTLTTPSKVTKGIYETQRQIYQGSHTTGSLLKTVLTCYNGNTANCATSSIIPNRTTIITQKDVYTTLSGMSQSSLSETKYDGFGNLTEGTEYDFTGTLLSDRVLVYGTYTGGTPPCAQISTFIRNRVCSDTTSDSGGIREQTYNTYSSNGNRTQTSRLVSGAGNGTGVYLNSSATYYSNGTVQYSFDTNGNKITYTYGNCNGTMLTQVQEPMSLSRSMAWDCVGGVPTSTTDENGKVTSYKYLTQAGADPFWRLLEIDRSDGGVATATYHDTASPPNIVATDLISSSSTMSTQTNFDGFGHSIQTALTSDPEGTAYTVKAYDPLERLGTAYNPTRCNPPTSQCGETTWGPTGYTYDALGRLTQITEPDGSKIVTSYSGNCKIVTDEASKARKSCTDALGRVTGLWEDPGSSPHLNYETDYTYDGVGNLLTVTQQGGASSSSWRSRNFVYDKLSRVTQANNPESGTIQYSYTLAGGALCSGEPKAVCSRTALSPNQPRGGLATVTTSYTYDAMNRLTGKSYSDTYSQNPPTPAVTYGYDGVNLSCPTPVAFAGNGAINGLGRRTAMCYTVGSKSWTYDPMGRIAQENDRFIGLVPPYGPEESLVNGVPTLSADTNYAYYLNGDLQTVFYPGPGNPEYEFSTPEDSAGRVTFAGDAGFNMLESLTYAPDGQLVTAVVGASGTCNGSNISNTYNKRLQPVLVSAASPCTNTTILNLTYNFHLGNGSSGTDNGNLLQIANGKDNNRSQNFFYDSLNRIQQAYTNGSNWGETYTIDAWGNLTNRTGVTGKTNYEPLSCSANTQNQLSCFAYDAAGNLIQNGSVTYTYDSENRLIATAGTSYVYDGDGQRVEKCTEGSIPGSCTSNATGMFYWLHAGGGTLAESDLGGNFTAAYGLIYGQVVSRVDLLPSPTAHYYYRDHLGTTNVVTDAFGNVLNESDYYPYGGEIPVITGDSNRYKFTGKERDSESGLDNFGARYNASTMGRFMSPDPLGGHQEDPQTLNRYSYVRNNPLSLTDPTGLDFYLNCSEDSSTCQGGHVGTTTTTTDANGSTTSTFTPTVVTSASLQDPNSGNTATVNENGVQITTGGQTYQGAFISNTPAADVQGSGQLQDFSFHINGNCGGSCFTSGAWSYNGTLNQARTLLYDRGSFTIPFEDARAGLGLGAHPFSTQHRFGGADCSFLSCPNSPHLSVAFDPGSNHYVDAGEAAAAKLLPNANVPSTGGFHVDAHADWFGHAQDVSNAPPH